MQFKKYCDLVRVLTRKSYLTRLYFQILLIFNMSLLLHSFFSKRILLHDFYFFIFFAIFHFLKNVEFLLNLIFYPRQNKHQNFHSLFLPNQLILILHFLIQKISFREITYIYWKRILHCFKINLIHDYNFLQNQSKF